MVLDIIEHDNYQRARNLSGSLQLTGKVDCALDKLVADAVAGEKDLDAEDKNRDDDHVRLFPNDSPEKKVARINSQGRTSQIQWLIREGYTEEHIVSCVYSPPKQVEWLTQKGYTQEYITSHIEGLVENGWSKEEIRETLKNFDRDTSPCPEPD